MDQAVRARLSYVIEALFNAALDAKVIEVIHLVASMTDDFIKALITMDGESMLSLLLEKFPISELVASQ